jgi:hypothetical protein
VFVFEVAVSNKLPISVYLLMQSLCQRPSRRKRREIVGLQRRAAVAIMDFVRKAITTMIAWHSGGHPREGTT